MVRELIEALGIFLKYDPDAECSTEYLNQKYGDCLSVQTKPVLFHETDLDRLYNLGFQFLHDRFWWMG